MHSLSIIGSTAPGDGHIVHGNPHEKEEARGELAKQESHPGKVPFREQVIGLFFFVNAAYMKLIVWPGYAQITRGTVSELDPLV